MIEIFTDGSADNMKKDVGGIGVYFYDDKYKNYNISKKYTNKPTNINMELKACIEGIEQVIEIFKDKKVNWDLTIYTDSQYSIDTVEKYSPEWIKYGWLKKTGKQILNLDEIKKLYVLAKCYNVNFVHVRSHKKEPANKNSLEWKKWFGNKMADKLANEARNN